MIEEKKGAEEIPKELQMHYSLLKKYIESVFYLGVEKGVEYMHNKKDDIK